MARPTITTVFLMCLFVLRVHVAAMPITPSAADAERLAERMRAEGVSEVCFPGQSRRLVKTASSSF
jgi:hypothetical protein